MNTAKSVAGVEGSPASFILYSLRLENERVVIAVMPPMPAGKTNFSNFPPRAADEKENRNQPLSQLVSLKSTAVSVQIEASLRSKILKQYTSLGCWVLTVALGEVQKASWQTCSTPLLRGHFRDQPWWHVAFWGLAVISKVSRAKEKQ